MLIHIIPTNKNITPKYLGYSKVRLTPETDEEKLLIKSIDIKQAKSENNFIDLFTYSIPMGLNVVCNENKKEEAKALKYFEKLLISWKIKEVLVFDGYRRKWCKYILIADRFIAKP